MPSEKQLFEINLLLYIKCPVIETSLIDFSELYHLFARMFTKIV